MDGFVAKFMGDGVLAYFGFPRAREEVMPSRSGLVWTSRPPSRSSKRARGRRRSDVRIGIATGIVVVGDQSVWTGLPAQEQAVVRVETAQPGGAACRVWAEPGSVVTRSTRRC